MGLFINYVIVDRGGLPKRLQYYIGVVWQKFSQVIFLDRTERRRRSIPIVSVPSRHEA